MAESIRKGMLVTISVLRRLRKGLFIYTETATFSRSLRRPLRGALRGKAFRFTLSPKMLSANTTPKRSSSFRLRISHIRRF